jgi:hypothetical protein
MIKIIAKSILSAIIVLIVFTMLYNTTKALPEGMSIEGVEYSISNDDIEFLHDLTYIGENGSKIIEQSVFKNVFEIINNSQRFIIIDMFLFNTDYAGKEKLIPLTTEMRSRLIEKKLTNPEMEITFITDEINTFYGSYESEYLVEMKEAGIDVIVTDLSKLRDSNPIYSGFWRVFLKGFGTEGEGKLKHPLGNDKHNVTLRAWMKLLNTKANHRKVIIADSNDSVVSLITSANPHEPSSMHSNVALLIRKNIWKDILEAEQSVAKFSGGRVPQIDTGFVKESNTGDLQVQLITEGKIKKSIMENIGSTQANDSIDIAMFYISDRDIVKSLLEASERGVDIRLILDPNKDAFAREKNGIPNREVGHELVNKSNGKIKIRWYDTRGEQFHTKMVIIKVKGKYIIYLGSANLTRRNIGDLNAEADVKVIAPLQSDLSQDISRYYTRLWSNENGNYTVDFSAYDDDSTLKSIIYQFQEGSGLSSF